MIWGVPKETGKKLPIELWYKIQCYVLSDYISRCKTPYVLDLPIRYFLNLSIVYEYKCNSIRLYTEGKRSSSLFIEEQPVFYCKPNSWVDIWNELKDNS